MTSDAERSRSFGQVAEQYHRYRPRTPAALLDWALPESVDTVLDLAAGTGVLTELLVPRARTVVAVEPDPDMRAVLGRVAPTADIRTGTAEAIPLPGAAVDAVLISSAWHWFDVPRASAEIARVLRDDGRLAVLGNGLEETVDWIADLRRPIADPVVERLARPQRVQLPDGAPFTDLAEMSMAWTRSADVGDLLGLLGTYSRVITAGEAERVAWRDHATAVLAAEPSTRGRDRFEIPMRSSGFRARRCRR